MSVTLLQPGRALPLTFFLEANLVKVCPADLRREAMTLCAEIASLNKPNAWHIKKGFRLIEIGTLLDDYDFVLQGSQFLCLVSNK